MSARSVFMIPVFNQVRELPWLMRELEGPLACDEVVFVNNGSSDGSEVLMRESGRPVLEVRENRGIGYAFQIATRWAMARGFDVFGVIAGNGKMLPSEMPRVLDPIARGEADFVWGSRFLEGGDSPNLPAFRRGAIPMVNRFVQLTTGHRITDATCGYAAYRLSLFERARFDWEADWLRTYGFEYYLRAQVLLDGGVRWREVPITMRYPESGPYSKIRPFVGWYAMLRPWVVASIDRRGFAPSSAELA
ncbi:MAG: glycosyltransferase family 2 protein [Sandaracinaceae bacterium]